MVKLQFTNKDKRNLSQNVGQVREKAKFILILFFCRLFVSLQKQTHHL